MLWEQRVVRCVGSRGGITLAGSALGGLQRIDFAVSLPVGGFVVGGHVTGAYAPFDGRIGKYQAVLAVGEFLDLLTTFTLFNHRVAGAPVELTSFFAHEITVVPLLYRSTNHDNHILSVSEL